MQVVGPERVGQEDALVVQKCPADVHVEDVLLIVEARDDPIDLRDFVPHRIARNATREHTEQQDLRVRKVCPHFEDDRADALGDFRAGVRAGVVRADHHHHGLRLKALAFAIAQTPQHALRRIAGNGEVCCLDVAEVLREHRLVLVVQHPPVGDRVAMQQQVDVAGLRRFDKTLMPRSHSQRRLRERRSGVEPRRLQHHQGFVFLEKAARCGLVGLDERLDGCVDLRDLCFGRTEHRDLRRYRGRRTDYDRRARGLLGQADLQRAGGKNSRNDCEAT